MEGLKPLTMNAADVAASSDVRAFEFGEDDLSLMGDYYALRLINERFARHARGVFLPMLRLQPPFRLSHQRSKPSMNIAKASIIS